MKKVSSTYNNDMEELLSYFLITEESTILTNQENKAPNPERYVVMRDEVRVSDDEYFSEHDAQPEYQHWLNIIKRWPDNSKIKIVKI